MKTTQVRESLAEATDITITLSASVAAVVCKVTDLAQKRGEDRSFEYWLEECVLAGAAAKERSWEYSDEARNNREFKKALANSRIKFVGGVPANLTEQIAFAELCVKFHQYDVSQSDVIELKKQLASSIGK